VQRRQAERFTNTALLEDYSLEMLFDEGRSQSEVFALDFQEGSLDTSNQIAGVSIGQ
jgi:hypothetical protein